MLPQDSAQGSRCSESGLLPIFVNEPSVQHGRPHSLMCLAELSSYNGDNMAAKPKAFTIWLFEEKEWVSAVGDSSFSDITVSTGTISHRLTL